MRLSHDAPLASSPPSDSLRARVRGQAPSGQMPPASTRRPRQVDPAHLQAISLTVETIATKHLNDLAERTGELFSFDRPQMRTAIESAISAAIDRAWNRSPYTQPPQPCRPERDVASPFELEGAS